MRAGLTPWVALFLFGCTSSAGTAPEPSASANQLSGAWRATKGLMWHQLVLEPDGRYRELSTAGPIKIVASGRWTSDATTLELRQEQHESFGPGGPRKEPIHAPSKRPMRLDQDALVLGEHRYQRIGAAEAEALFPVPPTAAQQRAQESSDVAALRAEVERLQREAQSGSGEMLVALRYNDALREARRKAAVLDVPELMRATIALKHRGVEELDACSMLAEALYAACNYNSLRALDVLIEAGMRECGMLTADAAREARAAGHEAAAKRLEVAPTQAQEPPVEQPRGVAELHRAARGGDYAMVKAWLDQGVAVDALDRGDPMQRTPLMLAALGGHFEIVKLLVARGADLEEMDTQGDNAFILAEQKSPEIHKWLLAQVGEAPTEPVKRAPIDFKKDPAQLDPGALMNTGY